MSSTQNEDELERVFNVIILYAHGEKTREEAKAALQALLAKAENRARIDEHNLAFNKSVELSETAFIAWCYRREAELSAPQQSTGGGDE